MNRYLGYKTIDSSRREIRLVILAPASVFSAGIHCSLQHVYLNSPEKPQYEALSYTWGDPGVTKEILLNGESFQVTTNLESALRHLRLRKEERVLWVDAIAINQNDTKERGDQVAMMGLVYQSAKWDLLWMGDGIAKYRYAKYVLAHCFSEDDKEARAEFARIIRNKPSVWSHLMAFFEAPVWQRMWIVQELALAKEVRVMCGLKELDWMSLRIVANILTSPQYVERVPPSSVEGLVQVISTSSLRTRDHALDGASNDLLLLWYEFGWATCFDPRDRIYALLNIVTDRLGIIPDYTIKPDLLFRTVARNYLQQQQDLKILGYRCVDWPENATRSTLKSTPTPYNSVPSWCPDFGSSLQSYAPRFFKRAQKSSSGWKGIPWTEHSTQLLNTFNKPDQLVLMGISLNIVALVTESTSSWPDKEILDHYYKRVPNIVAEVFEPNYEYFNGDTVKRAYWVTLCSGMARTNKDHWETTPLGMLVKPSPSQQNRGLSRADILSPPTLVYTTEPGLAPSDATELRGNELAAKADYQFKATLLETTLHHSFCMTEDGYMALVPDTTLPGDILCAFRGGATPFVLRSIQGLNDITSEDAIQDSSREGDLMELIGSAYAYGFMDGLPQQWLEEGIRQERRFVLV